MLNRSWIASLLALVMLAAFMPAQAQQSGYADQAYPVGPHWGTGWDLTNDAVSHSLTDAAVQLNGLTSLSLAKSLIQFTSVTLTPAQIKTMYDTPVQIVAAPGTGLTVVPVCALMRFAYTTPQYTSGGDTVIQYDSTAHGAGTTPLTVLTSTPINAAASSDTILQPAATTTTAGINKGVYVSNKTGDFATGTVSTLTVYLWYMVL